MKKYSYIFFTIIVFLVFNSIKAQDTNHTAETKNLITESFQIPSYALYQKEWNNEHIRLKALDIPFSSENDMKIVLVENNNPFVFPCHETKIISPYGIRGGRMHTGIDLKQKLNDSIFSCFDGVVRMAKSYSGYGNTVVIRHYNGLETIYSHLNKIKVEVGEIVKAGQLIGLAGRTGRTTTEHLHFEVRFLYQHFNPGKMIDFETETLLNNILTLDKKDLNISDPPKEEFTEDETPDTPSESPSYHIIKQGDTLYALSRKYHISVEKLCQLNHISENSILSLGQKIKLK